MPFLYLCVWPPRGGVRVSPSTTRHACKACHPSDNAFAPSDKKNKEDPQAIRSQWDPRVEPARAGMGPAAACGIGDGPTVMGSRATTQDHST